MDGQRVRADPPIQARVVVARAEVVEADLEIFLLPRKLGLLALRAPAVGAEVALDRAKGLSDARSTTSLVVRSMTMPVEPR